MPHSSPHISHYPLHEKSTPYLLRRVRHLQADCATQHKVFPRKRNRNHYTPDYTKTKLKAKPKTTLQIALQTTPYRYAYTPLAFLKQIWHNDESTGKRLVLHRFRLVQPKCLCNVERKSSALSTLL